MTCYGTSLILPVLCANRGRITVMEEGGYAASGVKHCVRPVDMTGQLSPEKAVL